MASKRLPVRHVREILRLKWKQGLTHRATAGSVGVSAGAVGSVVARAQGKNLTWEKVEGLAEEELEQTLYGPRLEAGQARPLPDPSWIHTELRRKGVTLELLHLEYLSEHPDGYRYTAFCDHYRRWVKQRRPSMRQVHKSGDKAFVDYSGKKPEIAAPDTGEVHDVELFVAVLGASNLTFVEASLTQQSHDWIKSHDRAFDYFGGVTALVVPDQLRSGVSSPCRYDPTIQRTYAEWASHYDTAILPARQRKPKDKAKVETGVQIAQRWILARLRDETFFSLAALNKRIAELLEELNDRPMRDYGGLSRRQLFEKVERAALRPLPTTAFVFAEWKNARVNIDYHIVFEGHFYSVPYTLVREEVEIRATAAIIEVLLRGNRVASHPRSYVEGKYSTKAEHMPKSHREHQQWSPSRLISWAGKVGPQTKQLTTVIIESRPHPEQGYRSCLGLMRLDKTYGTERLEAACGRALSGGARSFRHVHSILKAGLDKVPLDEDAEVISQPVRDHENVRGPNYYEGEEEE